MELSRLTRDGTAEPVSRDQILRHVRGQGNIHFPFSADHEQDWQPHPVDPYSAVVRDDHTYIHTLEYLDYRGLPLNPMVTSLLVSQWSIYAMNIHQLFVLNSSDDHEKLLQQSDPGDVLETIPGMSVSCPVFKYLAPLGLRRNNVWRCLRY